MKKLTVFECEFCKKQYRTETDCKKCEDNHMIPKEIIKCEYNIGDFKNYPHRITVLMSDGQELTYYR